MKRIREVIVVEGRYDKNTLSQVVDAVIVTLDGFSIFHNREKIAFLRRLAEKRGLIILTDSDGAGLILRGFIKGKFPRDQIKQAYIPDIPGKERRKRAPGKAGKLGVEGMSPETLLTALRRAGATFLDDPDQFASLPRSPITKADLFAWGLSGGEHSVERRRKLLKALSLPEHLSANALLEALNLLYEREECFTLLEREQDSRGGSSQCGNSSPVS